MANTTNSNTNTEGARTCARQLAYETDDVEEALGTWKRWWRRSWNPPTPDEVEAFRDEFNKL